MVGPSKYQQEFGWRAMHNQPQYLYCWWTRLDRPQELEEVPGQPDGEVRLMRYKPNWKWSE